MLSFGMIAYGTFWIAERSDALDHIGIGELSLLCIFMMLVAWASFLGFLWIGGRKFGAEVVEDERESTPENG